MRCGENYRFVCGMDEENEEWNCRNPNSPCFVESPLPTTTGAIPVTLPANPTDTTANPTDSSAANTLPATA